MCWVGSCLYRPVEDIGVVPGPIEGTHPLVTQNATGLALATNRIHKDRRAREIAHGVRQKLGGGTDDPGRGQLREGSLVAHYALYFSDLCK